MGLKAVSGSAGGVPAANLTGVVAVANGGTGVASSPKLFASLITSDQGITNNTPAKIQLNSINVFGTTNYWNGATFLYQPLVAGTYLVSAEGYVSGTTVTNLEVTVSKNGTQGAGGVSVVDVNLAGLATASQQGLSTATGLVAMNGSTDTLELNITASGTGSLLAKSVRNTCCLTIIYVGP